MNSAILDKPQLRFRPAPSTMSAPANLYPLSFQLLESETLASAPTAPVAVKPAPGFWESLLWVLAHFIVGQIMPIFALGLYAGVTNGGMEMVHANLGYAAFAGQILGVGLTAFALRVRVGRNWMKSIHLRLPNLIPCLLAILCLPGFLIMAGGATQLVQYVLGVTEPSRQFVINSTTEYGVWFTFLMVAVGAAVSEEFLCRGFLGRGFVGRYGAPLGVLLTSIIFGVMHMNIAQGFFAFLLGCYVHLAYLATRSLWVPVFLHLLNNAWVVLALAFVSQQEETVLPETGSPEWFTALGIGLVVLAVSLLSAWGLYRLSDRQPAVKAVA